MILVERLTAQQIVIRSAGLRSFIDLVVTIHSRAKGVLRHEPVRSARYRKNSPCSHPRKPSAIGTDPPDDLFTGESQQSQRSAASASRFR